MQDLNPVFQMLPEGLRPVAVILSAMAAVIASQALITGSYTLVSEAIHLDLLPHLEMSYPSDTKGQLYIGPVNWLMWLGCSLVVLYFRSGHKIESAYGLSITITMLMTTLLIFAYLRKVKGRKLLPWMVLLVFDTIEMVFFISGLGKFFHGGYFTAVLTLLILILMVIWYRGTQLENQFRTTLKIRDYIPILKRLHEDTSLLSAPDRAGSAEERGTAGAGQKILHLRFVYRGQLQVWCDPQDRPCQVGRVGFSGLQDPQHQVYHSQMGRFQTDMVWSGYRHADCGECAAGHRAPAEGRAYYPRSRRHHQSAEETLVT